MYWRRYPSQYAEADVIDTLLRIDVLQSSRDAVALLSNASEIELRWPGMLTFATSTWTYKINFVGRGLIFQLSL